MSPICAQDPRKEDSGSMAKSRPPTGSAPKVLTSDEFNVYPSIFQSSDLNNICNLGIDLEESANTEIDDEHIRDAFASPLFSQWSEAEADLRQTHHSNEESLIKGAQSVLASTGRRVSGPTQKRGSNQELDDDRIRTILEIQKKQLLSKAKSKILEYENQACLTEDYIRELKSKIECQDIDIKRAMERYPNSRRREQEVLHEELADRELALRENNIGGIHEVEALKRFQEVRVDEFSTRRRRMIEDPDTIDELTGKFQELPNEINCLNDSRDFKDAESVRSGPLSHVPSAPVLVPLPTYLSRRTAEPRQKFAA